jgi:hypothetical protein
MHDATLTGTAVMGTDSILESVVWANVLRATRSVLEGGVCPLIASLQARIL